MDVSPPPFHSSSSWYVLWALWVGSFWKCQRQGRPGTPSVWRVEDLAPPCSELPASACFTPSSLILPPGPSSAALLSGDDFYLELLGGISLSPQHRCLLPVSLSSLSPPPPLLSLYLWIGPEELQKCTESENVRSG